MTRRRGSRPCGRRGSRCRGAPSAEYGVDRVGACPTSRSSTPPSNASWEACWRSRSPSPRAIRSPQLPSHGVQPVEQPRTGHGLRRAGGRAGGARPQGPRPGPDRLGRHRPPDPEVPPDPGRAPRAPAGRARAAHRAAPARRAAGGCAQDPDRAALRVHRSPAGRGDPGPDGGAARAPGARAAPSARAARQPLDPPAGGGSRRSVPRRSRNRSRCRRQPFATSRCGRRTPRSRAPTPTTWPTSSTTCRSSPGCCGRVVDLAGDHPVVEVGCGPGHVTDFLDAGRSQGHRHGPHPGDGGGGPASVPRRRLRRRRPAVADAPRGRRRLGRGPRVVLPVHLAPAELPDAVSALTRPLVPGGWLVLALHAGTGTRVLDSWFDVEVDVTFVLHDPARLRSVAEAAGLVDLEWYHRGPITVPRGVHRAVLPAGPEAGLTRRCPSRSRTRRRCSRCGASACRWPPWSRARWCPTCRRC